MIESDQIDDIVADAEVEMTSALKRAFQVQGCDPACHCCGRSIRVGEVFKLACIKSPNTTFIFKSQHQGIRSDPVVEDEMLCSKCTPEMLIEKKEKNVGDQLAHMNRRGFSRPHQT